VLFIGPNTNFELLKLQQHFFPGCGSGYHLWSPHATLLIDKPKEIFKAIKIIATNFRPFKARIESIGLYEFFPKKIIKECKLMKERI